MAIRYIQRVAPNVAEGLVGQVYAQIKKEFGALAEPFTLHSPSPELLAGAWSACRESLLVGNVRRDVKEAVAATVSRINRCPYCVDAHTIMLNATSAHNSADAIIHQRDDQIRIRPCVLSLNGLQQPVHPEQRFFFRPRSLRKIHRRSLGRPCSSTM